MKTEKTSKFFVWAPIVVSVFALVVSVMAIKKVNRGETRRTPNAIVQKNAPEGARHDRPHKGEQREPKREE